MVTALLERLVRARSPSREEGPAVAVFEAWNAGRFPVVAQGNNRAICRDSGIDGPRLLLLSHYDTVPATPEWTREPWLPVVEDGRMFGLGANDAKGCLAAMMGAFETATVHRGSLWLVAAAEEEVGREGFEKLAPLLPRFDAAIVGEPTGMDIATAQNGLLVLDCVARGRAGHAARPQLADNAIYAMCRDIMALDALDLDRIHPLAGRSTLAVTMASAGERHNVIPGEAKFTVDIRPTAAYTPAELVALVRERVSAEVHVRSDRFRPVETPPGAAILAAAQAAWPAAATFASPTLSDWAHLRDLPAIKWGPGRSEVSHSADEWVELAMVEAAVGAYRQAADTFLRGKP
ncbi:MAG: M20/M25/M40 family metallo-hydrolase [Deltaproteobacteria bacterium]|nr:M20/M25/M40 family metallo-hydrolase [Deltaproteobacteria bacterium]